MFLECFKVHIQDPVLEVISLHFLKNFLFYLNTCEFAISCISFMLGNIIVHYVQNYCDIYAHIIIIFKNCYISFLF